MLAYVRQFGWETRRVVAGRLWPLQAIATLVLWRPQVVVVQKVAMRAPIEAIFRALSPVLVIDLDDAIYLGYPGSESEAPRYRRAVERMFAHADRSVVSNQLIADDLASVARVEPVVFPGPAPELARLGGSKTPNSVLWLGSPSTISHVRSVAYPAVSMDAQLKLTVVGASSTGEVQPNISEIPWTPAGADEALRNARVGLLPIVDTPWSRRSAGYKVLQYLSYDVVPVVRSMPFLETLLGDYLNTLAVVVDTDDAAQWLRAIRAAETTVIDATWRDARAAVFERLSIHHYAEVVLGGPLVNGAIP